MQVVTVLAGEAVPIPVEIRTLGPPSDVILVQVIALVAFLAQPLEPVLADQVIGVRRAVFIWAACTEGAVAFAEGFAGGAVERETKAVFVAEEGEEGEVIKGGGRGSLTVECWGCRRRGCEGGHVCGLLIGMWRRYRLVR